MSDSRVEDALRRQSQMEGDRGTWEGHWREVAERVLPRQRDFQQQKRVGGEKLSEKIFDSTAPLALERFAAAMESMLTPRTQRWHELAPPEALEHDEETKRYLYEVTSLLFRARYAPGANFASQAHENYMSLGAFGSGAIFVDELMGRGLRYRAIGLAELYFAENYQGIVDTVHRRFEYTARQAAQRFGVDNLPEQITKALDQTPDRKFEFLHCVKPREDADWSKMNYRGMAFASYYISFEGRKMVREGGYRTMRYAVSRYVTAPRETYGRSPAMTALASIKSANEMQKTLLRTGQLVAEPPILLADDGALSGFKMRPSGLNYGTISPDGKPLAMPFQVGANLPITLEMLQGERDVINEAFLAELFKALVEHPDMTATQAMLIAQQQGMLLGPTMGRQQSEMLGPLIQAEIDILSQAGVIPPPPQALAEHGGDVEIEYASPLSRAQRADEGVAILTTVQQAVELAQVDPSALDKLKVSDIVAELADINGMPSKLIRSDEEAAQIQAERAQAQQMAAASQLAPAIGKTAKDMAQAQAMSGGSPSQIPANAA